jgi:hypothetical protein
MTTDAPASAHSPAEDAILSALAAAPAGKSIDPMNVAKGMEPERWQRLLPHVRTTAIQLARQGRLVILRHNKPADPDTFRGVWRMRLPTEAEAAEFAAKAADAATQSALGVDEGDAI